MINQEQTDIVQYRLRKALEAIDEADFLFEHKYWNSTINKLYYCCFYAVSALLGSIEVFPKTHSGTIQMFGLHFIKTDIFDKEANNLYNKLFDMRQKADYEDAVEYEESDAFPLLVPTREFIIKIKNIIQSV